MAPDGWTDGWVDKQMDGQTKKWHIEVGALPKNKWDYQSEKIPCEELVKF